MWERMQQATRVEPPKPQPAHHKPPEPPLTARAATPPEPQVKRASEACIGPSIHVKGEVSGTQHLRIDGHVEGRIELLDHNLTIGPSGRVHAEIHVKSLSIGGEVTGNVSATEKLELTDSGRLEGNIHAPRVALADGAHFKGQVHMEMGSGGGRS